MSTFLLLVPRKIVSRNLNGLGDLTFFSSVARLIQRVIGGYVVRFVLGLLG